MSTTRTTRVFFVKRRILTRVLIVCARAAAARGDGVLVVLCGGAARARAAQ